MKHAIALISAFAVGVIFALIFFYYNDPDQAGISIVVWYAIVLFPASLLFSWSSWKMRLLNTAAILAGTFIGTCTAIVVYYPEKAGLFPIAAGIYTILAFIPVFTGAAFCSLLTRQKNKA